MSFHVGKSLWQHLQGKLETEQGLLGKLWTRSKW